MTEIIRALDEYIIAIVIASAVMFVVAIKTIASVISGASRERSRREIAAYIAEGSMSPEQGERLMKADIKPDEHA